LELEKLAGRERGNADEYNVPRMNQEDLAKGYMNEEQRREALALAKRYAEVVWPRRIRARDEKRVCRLMPQFAGDPEPYGSDPSPH
jgi:hypothetical protein